MYLPKKQRFDFYKALQAAQYHTAVLLDRPSAEIPAAEAGPTIDYLRKLIADLRSVEGQLLSMQG